MSYTTEVRSCNDRVVWDGCQRILRKVFPSKITHKSGRIYPISASERPIAQIIAIGTPNGVDSTWLLASITDKTEYFDRDTGERQCTSGLSKHQSSC